MLAVLLTSVTGDEESNTQSDINSRLVSTTPTYQSAKSFENYLDDDENAKLKMSR